MQLVCRNERSNWLCDMRQKGTCVISDVKVPQTVVATAAVILSRVPMVLVSGKNERVGACVGECRVKLAKEK